jgi:hypothetical protein
MEEALIIDETHVPALVLKGKIEIEKKYYVNASDSFEAAIGSDLDNWRAHLWNAYAKYLKVEYSCSLCSQRKTGASLFCMGNSISLLSAGADYMRGVMNDERQ